MQELYRQLDSIVEEKTFSLEAVNAIKKMREEYKGSLNKNVMNENTIKEYLLSNENMSKRVKLLEIDIAEWNKRENGLKMREESMATLEKSWACEQVRAGAYKEMFDRLFGNTIVRESVQKNVSQRSMEPMPGYQASYPGAYVPTHEKVVSKTEETVVTEKESR